MLNGLSDKIFLDRMIYQLARKRYAYVSEEVSKRESERGASKSSMYAKALLSYYQKDLDETYAHFKELFEHHRCGRKTEVWAIKNTIGLQATHYRDYAKAALWGDKLLPIVSSKAAKVLIGNYLRYTAGKMGL